MTMHENKVHIKHIKLVRFKKYVDKFVFEEINVWELGYFFKTILIRLYEKKRKKEKH